MFETLRLVPLRAWGNLKRPHVLGYVHGRQVERQRVQPPAPERLLWRWKIPMPGLFQRTGVRHIKPDFNNLVVRPEHRLAHGDDPRMSRQLDKTADVFRVNFDVVAVLPASHRAAGTRERVLIKSINFVAKVCDPLAVEGPLQPDNARTVDATHDLRRSEEHTS